jgi:pimeloyl-ACP methyl ester carboxylesterase
MGCPPHRRDKPRRPWSPYTALPDAHALGGIAAGLSGRFRVVTYPVRGAGASDRPSDRAAYRLEQLVAGYLEEFVSSAHA